MRAGDAGIVTIAQIKPISVQFTLPQQQLAQVNAALANGPVRVEALASDGPGSYRHGIVDLHRQCDRPGDRDRSDEG